MGLDMYLEGSIYLSTFDKEGESLIKQINDLLGLETEYETIRDERRISHNSVRAKGIEIELGYWRKDNWIHNWFVREVQNGKDDCGTYEVSEEKQAELLQICKDLKELLDTEKLYTGRNIMKDVAFGKYAIKETNNELDVDKVRTAVQDKLPIAESGFFFGMYAKDVEDDSDYMYFLANYFYDSLVSTIEYLEKANQLKKNPLFKWMTVRYTSSW